MHTKKSVNSLRADFQKSSTDLRADNLHISHSISNMHSEMTGSMADVRTLTHQNTKSMSDLTSISLHHSRSVNDISSNTTSIRRDNERHYNSLMDELADLKASVAKIESALERGQIHRPAEGQVTRANRAKRASSTRRRHLSPASLVPSRRNTVNAGSYLTARYGEEEQDEDEDDEEGEEQEQEEAATSRRCGSFRRPRNRLSIASSYSNQEHDDIEEEDEDDMLNQSDWANQDTENDLETEGSSTTSPIQMRSHHIIPRGRHQPEEEEANQESEENEDDNDSLYAAPLRRSPRMRPDGGEPLYYDIALPFSFEEPNLTSDSPVDLRPNILGTTVRKVIVVQDKAKDKAETSTVTIQEVSKTPSPVVTPGDQDEVVGPYFPDETSGRGMRVERKIDPVPDQAGLNRPPISREAPEVVEPKTVADMGIEDVKEIVRKLMKVDYHDLGRGVSLLKEEIEYLCATVQECFKVDEMLLRLPAPIKVCSFFISSTVESFLY
jgi:hypothetical protein